MDSIFSLTKKLKLVTTDTPIPVEITPKEPESSISTEIKPNSVNRLDSVRQAMARMNLENVPTENQIAIAEQIEKPEKTDISANIEVASSESAQVEIQIPTIIPTPIVEEKVLEKKDNTSQDSEILNSVTGHELVSIFLIEINDLLKAGNVLQELNSKKERAGVDSQKKINEARLFEDDAASIKNAIDALMSANNEETLLKSLSDAKTAMESYDKGFSLILEDLKETERKDVNELIVQINGKKSEIKKILGVIGGPENFEKIKSVIRFAEKNSKAFFVRVAESRGYKGDEAIKTAEELFSQTVSEFISNSKITVGEDLAGMKLLAGSGDIIGVFQRIAMNKAKELKNKE